MTPSLIWGNILHEVMQACLCEGRWDSAWLDAQIGDVVRRSLGDLMRVNMSIEQAVSEVRLRAQGLRSFADKYMSDTPKVGAPPHFAPCSACSFPFADGTYVWYSRKRC